jgi:hypothetical protein
MTAKPESIAYRERLKEIIAENPGITTRAIAEIVQASSRQGLRFHLDALELDGEIVQSVRMPAARWVLRDVVLPRPEKAEAGPKAIPLSAVPKATNWLGGYVDERRAA